MIICPVVDKNKIGITTHLTGGNRLTNYGVHNAQTNPIKPAFPRPTQQREKQNIIALSSLRKNTS